MRTLFLFPAIVCVASGPAAADAPFAPRALQPDYAVTMVQKSYLREVGSRNVTHHGNWTRVDLTKDSHHITEYFSANGIANIRIYGQRYISLVRGGEPSSHRDNQPRNSGERQTHLGESCTVWDAWRTKKEQTGGSNLSHLSCITDDGIELWQRSVSGSDVMSSAEATRVERRQVTLEEVKPPGTLLKLDWWDQNPPALTAPITPDHETVMELFGDSTDAGKSTRTTRRLGPWQLLEETVGGVRRKLEIAHDSRRMRFEFASDKSGVPKHLTITRLDSTPADTAVPTPAQSESMQPKSMNRTEAILGEICRWFDMMPEVADAGRSACLTNDGITLKDVRSARGTGVRTWTAVRLSRRPVSLDEIKPPAALLEPQLWGIE